MKHPIVAPSVGESITEVSLLKWLKQDGEAVKNGDVVLEVESDKATVEVVAEADGALKIIKQEGETVPIGELLAEVDDSASGSVSAQPAQSAPAPAPTPTPAPAAAAPPAQPPSGLTPISQNPASAPAAPTSAPAPAASSGHSGRISKGEVLNQILGGGAATSAAPNPSPAPPTPAAPTPSAPKPSAKSSVAQDRPGDRRVPMSRIRKRIAERLVQVQQEAALLTTFNEIDMKPIMDVRAQHKDRYKAKHSLPFSFMSFFTLAAAKALQQIEGVNASIEGTDIIYHDYQDIGIAVGTDRGLVVPVLREAGKMNFIQIDQGITDLAKKARDGKLSIADMSGGTFTISNGGTYGSMLSTPILNPPQSGILGMHNIVERPVVADGQIVARPIMYVALSYDHRIIDGKEAVTFLVIIKDHIEHPEKLGLEFLNEL